MITAYAAAATLYGNGQRPGVITTLTISEYGMREENYNEQCGDVVVIPCVHHKTGAQGLAYLVITKDTDDIIEYYLQHIRQVIAPKDACKNLLFLTISGEEYTQVYRRTKKALATESMVPPPPGLYRILISTEARRHLDEMSRRKTIKHLSHSASTSEHYYEFLNQTDATEAHATISTLSTIRRWTQSETNLLTLRWPLTGDPPTMKAIQTFIKGNAHIKRTCKEVISKWNQLHRIHNFKQ